MLTQRRILLAATTAIALLGSAYQARATSVEFFAPSNDPLVKIVLTEDEGDIIVSLSTTEDDVSLRKFFLNISDNELFEGLRVTGDDVSAYTVNVREPKRDHGDWKHRDWKQWDKDGWKKHDRDWDKEWDKDKGWHKSKHKHGDRDKDKHRGKHDWDKKHRGKKDKRDLLVLLGTDCCKEGLFETTFVLDAVADLALTDFVDERVGVSVVGFEKGECDPKLVKIVTTKVPNPIPEPASALLLGLGLGGLALAGRNSQTRSAARRLLQ